MSQRHPNHKGESLTMLPGLLAWFGAFSCSQFLVQEGMMSGSVNNFGARYLTCNTSHTVLRYYFFSNLHLSTKAIFWSIFYWEVTLLREISEVQRGLFYSCCNKDQNWMSRRQYQLWEIDLITSGPFELSVFFTLASSGHCRKPIVFNWKVSSL